MGAVNRHRNRVGFFCSHTAFAIPGQYLVAERRAIGLYESSIDKLEYGSSEAEEIKARKRTVCAVFPDIPKPRNSP